MKYYDIHTHRKSDVAIDENCVVIHSLSHSEIVGEFDINIPNLYYSCGIHPWYITDAKITTADIYKTATSDKKIVAIGECGLDKLIDVPMDVQKQIFSEQIELATKLSLPLVIHCTKAWDELLELYRKFKPTNPWILHGFRGGRQQTEQLMRFGFYFSIGEHFNKEALAIISPNRLFLETDESSLQIQNIYTQVANALSCKIDDLINGVEQNVSSLFNL